MEDAMSRAIRLIEANTLGESWMKISRMIPEEGYEARYDGASILELARLTSVTERPDPDDSFIKEQGDQEWLDWMHENFFVQKTVEELGDAASYAVRLFNYAYEGRDQVQWVAERIKEHPEARSATITTTTESLILRLRKSALNNFLEEDPVLASHFYRNFLEEFSSRFRHLNTEVTFFRQDSKTKTSTLNEINRDVTSARKLQNLFINPRVLDSDLYPIHGIKQSYIYDG